MAISKKILKQVNSVMKSVLRNRGVLYALCIIALFNIVMYANVKDFNSVITLLEEKVIEIAPLGFMRGRTFKNCWIVADEMQNSSVSQMKMLLTRLGENTRLVVTGDLDQHDRHEELNGLDDFLNKFKGKRSSSITSVEFDNADIQREEVVKEVLEIYSGDIPKFYESYEENSTTSKDSENSFDSKSI